MQMSLYQHSLLNLYLNANDDVYCILCACSKETLIVNVALYNIFTY